MNASRHTSHKAGLSLIESVIYVGVLAALSVMVVNMIIVSAEAVSRSRAERSVVSQGAAALERLLYEARLAESIDTTASVLSSTPGILKLSTIVSPSDTTPTSRTFSLASGSLMMQEGSATPMPLTSDVIVTRFIAYPLAPLSGDAQSEGVRIEMTLSRTVGKFTAEETLYGTAILRRSY